MNDVGRTEALERGRVGVDKISAAAHLLRSRIAVKDVIEKAKSANEITLYLSRPLSPDFSEMLRQIVSCENHPAIEIVTELQSVEYVEKLHRAGFNLFYGLGLPSESLLFLGESQGFVLRAGAPEPAFICLKNPEEIYFKLLWRRFGCAVLLSGSVRENDVTSRLFCLVTQQGREQWCRFSQHFQSGVLCVGRKVEVFGWEKWGSPVVEALTVVPCVDSDNR